MNAVKFIQVHNHERYMQFIDRNESILHFWFIRYNALLCFIDFRSNLKQFETKHFDLV